jgi:hypothetical protein
VVAARPHHLPEPYILNPSAYLMRTYEVEDLVVVAARPHHLPRLGGRPAGGARPAAAPDDHLESEVENTAVCSGC